MMERMVRQIEGDVYEFELKQTKEGLLKYKALEQGFKQNRDLSKGGWAAVSKVYVLSDMNIIEQDGKMSMKPLSYELFEIKDTKRGWMVVKGVDFMLPIKNIEEHIISFLKGE